MIDPTSGFSERYLAQVEAERQYVAQHLQGTVGRMGALRQNPAAPSIEIPLSSNPAHMSTLEEACRAAFAENRRKANPPGGRDT